MSRGTKSISFTENCIFSRRRWLLIIYKLTSIWSMIGSFRFVFLWCTTKDRSIRSIRSIFFCCWCCCTAIHHKHLHSYLDLKFCSVVEMSISHWSTDISDRVLFCLSALEQVVHWFSHWLSLTTFPYLSISIIGLASTKARCAERRYSFSVTTTHT